MILRNNSKNEWLNYHQGIDILAESTFEVPEKEGQFILRMLGHENWVVEVKAEEVIDKIKENDEVKEVKEVKEEKKEKPMKRAEIMKLLKEKGIKFTPKMKNKELLALWISRKI